MAYHFPKTFEFPLAHSPGYLLCRPARPSESHRRCAPSCVLDSTWRQQEGWQEVVLEKRLIRGWDTKGRSSLDESYMYMASTVQVELAEEIETRAVGVWGVWRDQDAIQVSSKGTAKAQQMPQNGKMTLESPQTPHLAGSVRCACMYRTSLTFMMGWKFSSCVNKEFDTNVSKQREFLEHQEYLPPEPGFNTYPNPWYVCHAPTQMFVKADRLHFTASQSIQVLQRQGLFQIQYVSKPKV